MALVSGCRTPAPGVFGVRGASRVFQRRRGQELPAQRVAGRERGTGGQGQGSIALLAG